MKKKNRLLNYYIYFFIYFTLNIFCSDNRLDLQVQSIPFSSGKGSYLDLRNAFNSSLYDDGIADNGVGGWTDEGVNDFYVYPEIQFGENRYRGYQFNIVNQYNNNGKNLLLLGHNKTWKNTPNQVHLRDINIKTKYVYLLHSEGRIIDKSKSVSMKVHFKDGSSELIKLRMGKELHNWYQGQYWNCYEEAREDAPEVLKNSNCNPEKYKKLGGKQFHKDVLKYATAKRWPVVQGLNSVSQNWSIPTCLWAFQWINPDPNKVIESIEFISEKGCLMGIAAITFSSEDYSLNRQSDVGKMRKPSTPSDGYFENREEQLSPLLVKKLLNQSWTKGIRRVEMRSEQIVTVRIDQAARMGFLKNVSQFILKSKTDSRYKSGIHPIKIDRFSRGSRYRSVDDSAKKIYLDHWLHLHFSKALNLNDEYQLICGDKILPLSGKKLKREISFKPIQTPNPSFKVNQVGYSNTSERKYIYLSSYLGDGVPVDLSNYKKFTIIDENEGNEVFKGKIEKVSDKDLQGKDQLYKLDISTFKKEGVFYAFIKGLGRSYTFMNGIKATNEIYKISHRGLFFQRSGIEIKEPYAEGYTRPMAHNKIYVTKKNTTSPWLKKVDPNAPGDWHVKDGPKKIHGGHYDAGDYDLRPMHISVPERLLSIYEAFPKKFYDGQVNIPENNNGIPDIIDEAAWNILSYEYIQDYAGEIRGLKGGVAPGMESYDHPSWGHGMGKDPLPYYMRKVHGPFSLCAAAIFAKISRIIEPFSKQRAKKYLERAELAYQYGLKHFDDPNPVLPTGKIDQGQNYSLASKVNARMWANVELYCTTGEMKYWNGIVADKDARRGQAAGAVSPTMATFSLLLTKREIPDAKIIEKFKSNLRKSGLKKATALYQKNEKQGYASTAIPKGGWGSTSAITINMEDAIRYHMIHPNQEILNMLATSVDFTLGMNPSEMSWMTGAGHDTPQDVVHLDSWDDGIEEPRPGILWYGPTSYWWQDKVKLYPDKKHMGFYRRVVDTWAMISQCEFTIWETQAPFLMAVSCLLPDKK